MNQEMILAALRELERAHDMAGRIRYRVTGGVCTMEALNVTGDACVIHFQHSMHIDTHAPVGCASVFTSTNPLTCEEWIKLVERLHDLLAQVEKWKRFQAMEEGR